MKPKIKRCKYAKRDWPNFKIVNCVLDKENVHSVCEEDCEKCSSFDSKYIEYPITVTAIENRAMNFEPLFHEAGSLCRVKPCGDVYRGKTFLGVLIGDLPTQIMSSYNKETGVLTNGTLNNPAIFVPELKKIIWGAESFWDTIDSEDDLKDITDSEINDVWYVQLLKAMSQNKEEKDDDEI